MKISSYFVIVSLFFLLSCKSKEKKDIEAAIDKMQGNWVVDKLTLPPNAPDSLQNVFKRGEFLFEKCITTSSSSSACGGEVSLNDIITGVYYKYSYQKNQYEFGLLGDTNTRPILAKMIQIFDGNWEIIVDGNKMTAKRKDVLKPYLPQETLYKGEVMFTATRK